jgi:dTMP kinase
MLNAEHGRKAEPAEEVRGRFITFEGPEASGKSTHIRRLAERLRATGKEILITREPGGTPTGEAIRGILQHDHAGEPIAPAAETLLFEACRAQLVERVIVPALEKGTWVLCDRFTDSTTAYQGYGRGFDVESILSLNRFAVRGCEPHLTILLDIEAGAGLKRAARRNREQAVGDDRFEREAVAFHERVRAGYLALARRWPERIRVVDTAAEVGVVEEAIWKIVCDVLEP